MSLTTHDLETSALYYVLITCVVIWPLWTYLIYQILVDSTLYFTCFLVFLSQAYHDWLQKHRSEEFLLPGLEYSNEQLFFIGFAQVWQYFCRRRFAYKFIGNNQYSKMSSNSQKLSHFALVCFVFHRRNIVAMHDLRQSTLQHWVRFTHHPNSGKSKLVRVHFLFSLYATYHSFRHT